MGRGDDDNLVNRLVEQIRSRILDWSLPAGSRLVESRLCEELGASRSPVREALRILEARGLVEKVPHRGYSVRSMDERAVREIYEVRLALESWVVDRLAARGVDEQWVRRMSSIWDDLAADADPESLADRDEAFHESLAETLGNETLTAQLRDLNRRIRLFRVIDFSNERTIADARQSHLSIVEAIASCDTAAAREEIASNIRHAQQNIRDGIKEALARAFFRRNAAGGEEVFS